MRNWRVQSDDRGAFDEIAVSDTKNRLVLHAEAMSDTCLFVQVPGWRIFVNRIKGQWVANVERE